MNIFKRLNNFFSPKAQSYKILREKHNFQFMEKFYKSPFYSLSVYLTVLIPICLVFITCFNIYQSKDIVGMFILFLFLYNFASIMSVPTFGQFFLKKISRDILFKFTNKYDVLVRIDKERKKHILDQEELKRFIKKYIINDKEKKEEFALFLSKKKYKAVSKYDVIDFLSKKLPYSLNDGINETKTLFDSYLKDLPVNKTYRDRKLEKGLEIIEHLASDKNIILDKEKNIILGKEYKKNTEEVKLK